MQCKLSLNSITLIIISVLFDFFKFFYYSGLKMITLSPGCVCTYLVFSESPTS